MAESTEIIDEQMEKKDIKRDVDVKELYIAKRDLEDITDLSRFKNLKYLWLHNNTLRRLDCLHGNFRLSELYLNHNELIDITGAISHMATLEVLFLHNNQLEKLEVVVKEFQKMARLKSLNLFNNPIAQETQYRTYVIHNVPSLQLFDRKEVLSFERKEALEQYEHELVEKKESVAFGRRSEGPPSIYYPGGQPPLAATVPADYEVGNNFYRNNPPYATEDQAVKVRALHKSVMEYTNFDWSTVPRSHEKRTQGKQFERPQIITTRFR